METVFSTHEVHVGGLDGPCWIRSYKAGVEFIFVPLLKRFRATMEWFSTLYLNPSYNF